MYCLDSQVETLVFKSQGSLSNGYYTDLLQGHMTEKEEIQGARYIDHDMGLDVGPSSQSFFFPRSHSSPFSCPYAGIYTWSSDCVKLNITYIYIIILHF